MRYQDKAVLLDDFRSGLLPQSMGDDSFHRLVEDGRVGLSSASILVEGSSGSEWVDGVIQFSGDSFASSGVGDVRSVTVFGLLSNTSYGFMVNGVNRYVYKFDLSALCYEMTDEVLTPAGAFVLFQGEEWGVVSISPDVAYDDIVVYHTQYAERLGEPLEFVRGVA